MLNKPVTEKLRLAGHGTLLGVGIFELVKWAYSKAGLPLKPTLIPDATQEGYMHTHVHYIKPTLATGKECIRFSLFLFQVYIYTIKLRLFNSISSLHEAESLHLLVNEVLASFPLNSPITKPTSDRQVSI